MIQAKIIADSLSPQGHRITTMQVTFPRMILAELNTHRLFSRNSASSRAIPFEKMVKSVQENPFIPTVWNFENLKIKISTARCARVSYTIVGEEGKKHDYQKDIELHDKLLSSGHMSPFEHCAKVMTDEEYRLFYKGNIGSHLNGDIQFKEHVLGWCNNFRGFIQYRYLIENNG